MRVDYLRTYKLQQANNADYYPLSFDLNDPDLFKVHKTIHLGGAGHSADIYPSYNMTLWATDEMTFESGFTVYPSTQFSARVIKTQPELFQIANISNE